MGLNSMGEASHSLSTALTPYYYVETGVTNIEDNTYREVIVLWRPIFRPTRLGGLCV